PNSDSGSSSTESAWPEIRATAREEFGRAQGPSTTANRTGFISVRLVRMPVALFVQLRQHHRELRREIRLLALSSSDPDAIEVRIDAVFDSVDMAQRQASGLEQMEQAIADRLPSTDLELE